MTAARHVYIFVVVSHEYSKLNFIFDKEDGTFQNLLICTLGEHFRRVCHQICSCVNSNCGTVMVYMLYYVQYKYIICL